jgi:hypothetical protein
LGIDLEGRLDLVFKNPSAVIDIKRGGGSRLDQELQRGVGIQLAVYSYLIQTRGASFSPAAYYVAQEKRLITNAPDAFPSSTVIEGPTSEETWASLLDAVRQRRMEMETGRVVAAGNLPDDQINKRDEMTDHGISLAPQCRYCDLAAVCGHAFKE